MKKSMTVCITILWSSDFGQLYLNTSGVWKVIGIFNSMYLHPYSRNLESDLLSQKYLSFVEPNGHQFTVFIMADEGL